MAPEVLAVRAEVTEVYLRAAQRRERTESMTYTHEQIVEAAINAMVKGRHRPHCYSAHVPGQGYVNDGTRVDQWPDYVRQLEVRARAEAENMGWSPGYAEPGYDDSKKGILFANWNVFPRGLDNILERAGYAIEWSDEWDTCQDCNKAVRLVPDSHGWTPSYVFTTNGDFLCTACAKETN